MPENMWTVLVSEFNSDAKKTIVIVKTLHGLKSAAAAFRSLLASYVESVLFASLG